MPRQDDFTSVFVTAQDGLQLHARDYRPRTVDQIIDQTATRLPVLCLSGLTRTAADFHVLASALSGDLSRPRRVLAIDYRGRGASDYDVNPNNYSIPVEAADVIAIVTACDMAPAVIIGTSRGGLIAMALAAIRPTLMAGVVLNDIGPVIEPTGMMRIKSYVGRMPAPRDYEEGAQILHRLFGEEFTGLTPADWAAMAQRTWKRDGNRLVTTYDVNLARTLAGIEPDRPLASCWPQFDALASLPLMLVRGENTNLLSAATVHAMRERRPDMEVLEVPEQGHAPLLAEQDTLQRISQFIAKCDAAARNTPIRH